MIHYIAIVATRSCNYCKTAGSFAFVVISFDSDNDRYDILSFVLLVDFVVVVYC